MKTGRKAPAESSKGLGRAKPAEEHEPAESGAVTQSTAATEAARFPVVGIGASAGGLAAFGAFFSGLPADADPGMAFVLVQHLDPDHKSLLAELIRRYTRMQVFEAEDGMSVGVNRVYIIPPNRDMAILNGMLQLLEPSAPRWLRMPVDFFFRSLAQDQRERAVGIVLAGTGSDGTLGVRAIKGEGGMVMVQKPASAEFDGMPRSALATGLADFEMPPAEMPARLVAYAARAFGHLSRASAEPLPKDENALKKIFILLRSQTGHDFSQYKPGTTHRRIERRMAIQQVETTDGYVRLLQQTPDEVKALFGDMLIGVTGFFRDPEAFKILEEQAIPSLCDSKPLGAAIRVWTPGCSTGEEAYSIAILLQERLEALKQSCTVQLFATDVDCTAIATARAGLYPASIAADLSPERLARFFTAEPGCNAYRINKAVRDMLVFSEQDVIKDPPFSRLDLISCRNLLIYLGADLQKRLIPMFRYALNPGGFLFLGTSETVGAFDDLFIALDRKQKLYQRKDEFEGVRQAPLSWIPPARTALGAVSPLASGQPGPPLKLSPRELTEQAMLQASPTGVLVNVRGDIIYIHGRTGMYLELAQGNAGVNNILKTAREGLRRELAAALHKAAAEKESVRRPGLQVKTNGHYAAVNLTVRPLPPRPGPAGAEPGPCAAACAETLYLVTLEKVLPEPEARGQRSEVGGHSARNDEPPGEAAEETVAALKRELRAREDDLLASTESMAASTDELNSVIEEMQSVNEEQQSTNEELETSKEELQSVNEELSTVNAELQAKVTELSQANNDMNNLLAGTGIGTVFVDRKLRLLRFTPAAAGIINLIPSDLGRPLGHLAPNLAGYDRLAADVKSVLDSLTPKAVDVRTPEGSWYTLHILPYRTLDNVVEGAVLTFVDTTEMRRTQEREKAALNRLAVVVRDARDAVTVQDLEGRIIAWNPGAERLYGWSDAEALTMNVRDRIPANLRDEALSQLRALSRSVILEPHRTRRLTKQGAEVEVSVISTALANEAGQLYAVATTERVIGQA